MPCLPKSNLPSRFWTALDNVYARGSFALADGEALLLEAQLIKRFKLTDRITLSAMVDVFNALNANTELNIRHTTGRLTISETAQSIPAFQTPITILPPRIARFSARLSW